MPELLDVQNYPIAVGRTSSPLSHPLVQLTLVRLRDFYREPQAAFWSLALPLILASALGFAFRTRTAEVIRVGTTSAAVQQALAQDPSIAVELVAVDEAERQLRSGRLPLMVLPAPNGAITYRYDETNTEARSVRNIVEMAIQRAAGQTKKVETLDVLVREPGSRYIDFIIPGLLGMNLMGSALWGVGFAVVEARKQKLLKRLMVTPMSRAHYLLSFLISRLAMLVVEVSVLVGFGTLVFDVPLRGSLIGLVTISVMGSLAFSGLGLLIAARSTTIETASGLMNLVMLPMWMLSGVFFSAERFPESVQPIIQALPLTSVIDALRANMLEGAAFAQLSGELGALAVWATVTFAAALAGFRWK